ncbi:MAG: hypothetical protein GXO79_10460 [Chlorobi bacterium]|nr:hypothetical protein [Chlorobiota bacterium]
MNVKEFINVVLISEIKKIQQEHGHHYLSFGLISQGIEFLGACIDNHEFHAGGKSRTRFNKAIKELFPNDYHQYVKRRTVPFDLYSNLRCGLLHIVVPGSDIELIQESEISDFGNHLEKKEIRNRIRLVLVSQQLMSDFEDACIEIIRRINNNLINN